MSDGPVDFTQDERRILRELASQAYEAEVGKALTLLDAEFGKWREGKIASADLSVAIHEFHQHDARDLWSMYQTLGERTLVARALSRKLISWEVVPTAMKSRLELVVSLLGDADRDQR